MAKKKLEGGYQEISAQAVLKNPWTGALIPKWCKLICTRVEDGSSKVFFLFFFLHVWNSENWNG